MGDPLSIASGAIGLISVAASTAQSLNTLIADIRDAPNDIGDLTHDVGSLNTLLATTKDMYIVHGLKAQDATLSETFNNCLKACINPMAQLENLLRPYTRSSRSIGRHSFIRSISWTMRKGEIRALRERLRDGKASLTLAISVFNGHVSGKGQDNIRQDIATSYEQLKEEFSTLRIGLKIRDRLNDDVTTIYGSDPRHIGGDKEAPLHPDVHQSSKDDQAPPRRGSLSSQTDAGFPLRTFLASADQWENASAVDVPAPTDILTANDHATEVDEPRRHGFLSLPDGSVSDSTPLLTAIRTGNKRLISELVVNPDACLERSLEGQTALHICADFDDRATASLLLEKGADMNVKDSRKRTPFDLAVNESSVEVASLLIACGCRLGDFTSRLPDLFKDGDDREALRPIIHALAERFRGSTTGPFVLHTAIQRQQLPFIRALIEEGFDLEQKDDDGYRPLHHAIVRREFVRGTYPIVEMLVDAGADANAFIPDGVHINLRPAEDRDHTPLLLAANVCKDDQMVQYLISHGADPNFVFPKHDDIVLQCVCAFDAAIGIALIKGGTDVNHKSNNNFTALYWASICNNIPLLEEVLKQDGVDVNVQLSRQHHHFTVLHRCVEFSRIEALKAILRHVPDLNLKDEFGRTPLDLAMELNRTKAIEALKNA
ncbi:MAG: hypothetical protein M1820_006005 [Bogoriella megaspora]|nr:MAG: hypothetical protein M1820_006005 [Bogoriella megaspora]